MTCDECLTGIMKSQEQLLDPKTIDYLVEQLANGDFCASIDDERCPTVVDTVIRMGLPLLAAGADTSELPEVGNQKMLIKSHAVNIMANILCTSMTLDHNEVLKTTPYLLLSNSKSLNNWLTFKT